LASNDLATQLVKKLGDFVEELNIQDILKTWAYSIN